MQKAVTSFIFGLAVVGYAANSSAADRPLVDAHIHYSHDADAWPRHVLSPHH